MSKSPEQSPDSDDSTRSTEQRGNELRSPEPESSEPSSQIPVQFPAAQIMHGLQVKIPRMGVSTLVDKMTPEHISDVIANTDKDLDRGHQRKLQLGKQRPLLLGIGIVGAFALSWLFLQFDKPEYVAAIIAAVGAFLGGRGYQQMTRHDD